MLSWCQLGMNLGEWDFLVGATQREELNVSLGNDRLPNLTGGFRGLRVGIAARLETQTFRGQKSQELDGTFRAPFLT